MRSKQLTALVLCAAMLLSGCVMRPSTAAVPTEEELPTAEPAPTAEPLPATAVPETTEAPTPTPTAEPTAEPTPCAHPEWTGGVCVYCGEACSHGSWNDGACSVCGERCRHPSHDGKTLLCAQCGKKVPHNYLNSKCDMCGAKPHFTENILSRSDFLKDAPAGTVQTLTYLTHDFYTEGQTCGYAPLTKKMCVYLPAGYTPEEKYDVLILVHGTSGTETYWLLDNQQITNDPYATVRTFELLNDLMATGYCRKMIIATPCFYRDSTNQGDYQRVRDEEQFLQELRTDILPTLVRTYSTYAASDSLEDISAARNHFGYAGLSMGSIYAWTSVIPGCLDLFAWFGCFSGSEVREHRTALVNALTGEENARYPVLYFYNSAGGSDSMFAEHKSDYKKLLELVPGLEDGRNAAFTEIRQAGHTYRAWGTGLYNFLQVVFAQPEDA